MSDSSRGMVARSGGALAASAACCLWVACGPDGVTGLLVAPAALRPRGTARAHAGFVCAVPSTGGRCDVAVGDAANAAGSKVPNSAMGIAPAQMGVPKLVDEIWSACCMPVRAGTRVFSPGFIQGGLGKWSIHGWVNPICAGPV